MSESKNLSYKLKPFILTAVIILLDQITKIWVMKNIPLNTIYGEYLGDFLWIVHVRNTGAAFSLGAGSSAFARMLFFVVLPLVVLGFVAYAIFTERKFLTRVQKYFAAGILGGGLGTLIDRVFRFREGVVDFISVKFYGIFGMDRWPTFNISDSCVVIFVILFAISVIFGKEETK